MCGENSIGDAAPSSAHRPELSRHDWILNSPAAIFQLLACRDIVPY
jgi:hypothetical protein